MNRLFILFSSCFILLVAGHVPAFAADESISLTTYYPSPVGVYKQLRLYPQSAPPSACDDNNRGMMYYNAADNQPYICRGAALGWKSMGGGSSLTVTRAVSTVMKQDFTNAWIDIISLTVTTVATDRVLLGFGVPLVYIATGVANNALILEIQRDGVTMVRMYYGPPYHSGGGPFLAMPHYDTVDTPGAGAHTYNLRFCSMDAQVNPGVELKAIIIPQ
jgi:hypothetical protein